MALWLRFQRRAGALAPKLRRDILDAFNAIRDALTDAQLADLIATGQLDQIIDSALLDASFLPVRQRVVEATETGFNSALPDMPKAAKGMVGFDILSPDVITAVRKLDSRVVNTLKEDVRETVRAYIENGLRDGKNPRAIGRELRGIIGMSPTQTENLAKYEAKLRGLKRNPLSESQIDKKLAAYQRKAVAINAETNARTATLDSLKLGQRMSWDDAAKKGIIDPATLFKTWISVGDSRVRPEHQAMHGQQVHYESHFSNGDDIPGESTYQCRCVARYVIKRSAIPRAA